MWALIFYTRSSLIGQIKAETLRTWLVNDDAPSTAPADWLRLLAVLGSGEFDWLFTGYYIPFSVIGLFRFGIYVSIVPAGGSNRMERVK